MQRVDGRGTDTLKAFDTRDIDHRMGIMDSGSERLGPSATGGHDIVCVVGRRGDQQEASTTTTATDGRGTEEVPRRKRHAYWTSWGDQCG